MLQLQVQGRKSEIVLEENKHSRLCDEQRNSATKQNEFYNNTGRTIISVCEDSLYWTCGDCRNSISRVGYNAVTN